MCGSKPSKPKPPPKVVTRDLKKEEAEAAAKAAKKANAEAAQARVAKGAMMRMRAGVEGKANTMAAGAKAGATKLGG